MNIDDLEEAVQKHFPGTQFVTWDFARDEIKGRDIRIKALQDGIRGILGPLTESDVNHFYIARLRAILEDSKK